MKPRYAALVLATAVAVGFLILRSQQPNSAPASAGKGALADYKAPPLPPGVSELKFSEFFVTPIADRGLVLTEKLKHLDGERVRILGYMVRREEAVAGKFLFAAIPVQLHDHDSSDDLPPALVHVSVPSLAEKEIPYAPGLMLLTGKLSVGSKEETDGRISVVRLSLDPPPPKRWWQMEKRGTSDVAHAPSALQEHGHAH